jgi:PAS domain-containing protein
MDQIVAITSGTTFIPALIALLAIGVTEIVRNRDLRRRNRQLRTAIDSMAQGMCMFDAAERLVVCNTQYYRMYGLMPGDVKPGATLSEVLESEWLRALSLATLTSTAKSFSLR